MLELWWCVGRRHVARVTEGPRYHHLLLQYIIHHTSQQYIYCWWNLVGPDPPPLRSVSNNPTWSMHVYGTYPGTVHLMGVQNGADLKYIHYTYTFIRTYCTVHTVHVYMYV